MITAVIPNWNRAALLETALDSLRRQTRPAEEIIVVDNGSTDNSVQVAHAAGARVIEMHANAGFARAVNTGIQAATGDFIAIVNNDVHLEPAWLQTLWASLAPSEYGFATGKLLDASREGVIDGTWDESAGAAAPGVAGRAVRMRKCGIGAGRFASRRSRRCCSEPACSSAWVCWITLTSPTWRTSTSASDVQ